MYSIQLNQNAGVIDIEASVQLLYNGYTRVTDEYLLIFIHNTDFVWINIAQKILHYGYFISILDYSGKPLCS